MLERQRWVVHPDVATTVDHLLRGRLPGTQVRTVDDSGKVEIANELPPSPAPTGRRRGGWRDSGTMAPVTPIRTASRERRRAAATAAQTVAQSPDHADFQAMLDAQLETPQLGLSEELSPSSDNRVPVYPYGISREQLHHVIDTLHLPIVLTKELSVAQAVLALRSHIRNHSKLKNVAKARQLPIYTVKSNTIPQITRALQRLLDLDDQGLTEAVDLSLFARQGADDELEALEEARLAVEQIVIPKGQPVELLPRSAKIRKMQHELAEHYRLKSMSFGDEPNRRLRIFPA